MGSHSTRKEERRTRRRLRKERKRTLRREQKERHRLKRAEKAARKEARRLRREARRTDPAELDELRREARHSELRRSRYLRSTGAPTPVELYEARAWRDGAYRPPAQYAPPSQAELDELRRLRYLRAGDPGAARRLAWAL